MTETIKIPPVLEGSRIYLREMDPSEVSPEYCGWLNDPVVNQYLESRFQNATVKSVQSFVRKMKGDPANILFAIRLRSSDRHIGNIKLGPIENNHRRAEIGLVIGEKDCQGKGFASESMVLVSHYAFNVLMLHKLTAGCYAVNKESMALFTRCGFEIDGIRKRHCFYNSTYVDVVLFGLFNPRFGCLDSSYE